MINRLKTQSRFKNFDLSQEKSSGRSPLSTKTPLPTYTNRNYTPPSTRYFKNKSKSPLVTNRMRFFNTETLPTQNESQSYLLDKIKARKTTKIDKKPSPRLAQIVLKLYFLPFFQEQHKLDTDKLRYQSYRTPNKFKSKQYYKPLSLILQDLLTEATSELSLIQSKLELVLEEKHKMDIELTTLKKLSFRSQINKLAISSSESYSRPSNHSPLSILASCQAEKLQFFKVFTENMCLKNTLSHEKNENDDLKSQTIQSNFYNCEYYMINQISGESLKGAYYSLSALKNQINTEKILNSIQITLKHSHCLMVKNNDSGILTFSTIFSDREKVLTKSKQLLKQKASLWKDLKSVKNSIVSYISTVEASIKLSNSQKEKVAEEFEIKEKDFYKFVEDYKATKEKLEELQKASRANNPELMCKLCKKEFFEDENFNWSCCVHPSEWSGNMYWCCGADDKSAVGCYKRKHEEEDEAEESGNFELEKEKNVVLFCTGCKQSGHLSHSCLKDPNRVKIDRKSGVFVRNSGVFSKKSKVLEINRSLSSKKLWRKEKKVRDYESFGDIQQIKRLASRTVTPEIDHKNPESILNKSLNTQSKQHLPQRSTLASPSRTLPL